MASYYGVNADKALVDVPKTLAEQGESGGRLHCIYDQYTMVGAISQNEILYMGTKIPAGARVVEAILSTSADLDASGGTMDVGYAASADGVEVADPDAFFDGLDITAEDTWSMVEQAPGASAGQFKKFSAAVQPIISAIGSGGWDNDSSSNGVITLQIWYVID